MIPNLLSGIVAKLSGASLAAKVSLGVATAAAGVTGAGAADVLPDPVQSTVADAVETVTPFEIPNPREKRAAATTYAEAVRDWTRCVAENASGQGAQQRDEDTRRQGAFDPREGCGERPQPADFGLTENEADEYRPEDVPRPDDIPGRPEDTPGRPDDTPGRPEDTPGRPDDTPGRPGDTPSGGGSGDTPTGGPEDTPTGAPGDTPTGAPGDTPTEGPGDSPTGEPESTPSDGDTSSDESQTREEERPAGVPKGRPR